MAHLKILDRVKSYRVRASKGRIILYGLLPEQIARKDIPSIMGGHQYKKGDTIPGWWKRLEEFNNLEQACRWLLNQHIEGEWEFKDILEELKRIENNLIEKLVIDEWDVD